ncbi:asparaginase [Saliphagus sp. LR7]|uniref:asparaginase n=1 Tax=Saliphagus sp. LR7 TaxID=2282654 RepID=UPI000DF7EBDA|nr:asparaginase [Saliphagus sp. LR7]
MQPRVLVASTGGTIASTGADAKTPTESAPTLLGAVPGIEEVDLEVAEVAQASGFQMDFDRLEALRETVVGALADGVEGIVVTHGTDTMAESAYAIELLADPDRPVVFTGAQRPADEPGTDGPTNLRDAIRTAADPRFRAAGGTYLAFDDEVHAARRVRKGHTTALGTFESPSTGPVGEFTPDGLRLLRDPGPESAPIPDAELDPEIRVEIVTNALGADGGAVDRAREAGVDGIVLAGTGLGNATADLGAALERAMADGIPVVVTSRCPDGTTAGLYGGPGGGATLREAGAVGAGDLPPWKARLRLAIALSSDADVAECFGGLESDGQA